MFKLPARFRDPVIADRTVDLMAAAFWFCLGGWGISSVVTGLPTISDATTPLYELIWGSAIGLFSTIALGATVSTFFASRSVEVRIKKKVTELIAVCLTAGFIVVYPILVISASLGGDIDRVATSFAALSFLIFPTWRVRHLYFRIRKLREAIQLGAPK